MRRSIHTADRGRFFNQHNSIGTLFCLLFLGSIIITGCGADNGSPTIPVFLKSVTLSDDSVPLQPLRLQIFGDTLYVAYKGIPRLDMYSLDLKRVGSIDLIRPEPVKPSAFVVSDSQILVCDHSKGALVIYDRSGNFVDSFGLLPDQQTRITPLALARYEDVAYVADMGLKQILAISLADISNITSRGELILQVPGKETRELGFPSAVFVTPDGRLLIGDAGEGTIRVFTCDGREVYEFSAVPNQKGIAPQAFALDNVRDPSLRETGSFDPSGVREMGRIHVVDGKNGIVHMFNPLGKYLASYPESGRLDGPSDITIARKARRIFIADSRSKRIHIFSYEGE